MQILDDRRRLRSRSRRKAAPASSQRCAVSLRGAGGCTDGHVSWQFRHRGLRRRADAARPCGRVRIPTLPSRLLRGSRFGWSSRFQEMTGMAPWPSGRRMPTSTGSGSASMRSRASMYGVAASRCRISTCAAAGFLSGPRSPGSAVTRPRKSRSRRTSAASRAATTGTPIIRSRPISRPGAMRCMWRRQPTRPSISVEGTSMKSRSGLSPNGSSSRLGRPIALSSRPCPIASVASRRCRNGSMAARSSA